MAKLSLSQSPKFKLLVRALDLPVPYVRGYLELLWESAHFRDDPCFESFDEIEAICEWQGEDGILAQILLDRSWIDKENDCYVIHGYEEHLPYYVKERRRQAVYRANKDKLSQDDTELPQDNTVLSRDSNVTIPEKKHQEKRREEKLREENGRESELVVYLSKTWVDIKDPVQLEQIAKDTYPDIDLVYEAKRAYAWEMSDSKNRKKKHATFLNNWWGKAQERYKENIKHEPKLPRKYPYTENGITYLSEHYKTDQNGRLL